MLRAIKTILEGYGYCRNHPDERIRRRSGEYKKRLKMTRYLLTASTIFVQNRQSIALLREIKKSYRSQFGRMNLSARAASLLVVFFSIKEYIRCRIFSDLRVPKTSYRPFYTVYEHKIQPVKASYADRVKLKIPYRWIAQPAYSLMRDKGSPSSWNK